MGSPSWSAEVSQIAIENFSPYAARVWRIVRNGFTCLWEYPERACCDNNVKKFLDISPPE